MKIKHTVIKNEDVEKHLNELERVQMLRLLNKVRVGRASEGKQAVNTYLIVNTDEVYATDVVQILKDNGHWGPTHDPNQTEFRFEGDTMELP
ncbi:hypothetical protein [Paenibacillus amylolyticus]|uniref:Uncharacterized protein n=1 Tax=Paenibacillus amylolyticus TaxID=1451 RepID=A0A100VMC9_PAEAM|nr:hypothetical protein [Paenibacillus amylolyticus]GAS82434.1 unknown protein [Paenibacillus amylolyticus]